MPIRRRGGGGGTTLSSDLVAALEGANAPSGANPFATKADVGSGGGGDGVGGVLYLYNRMGGF
jgi:hypothetical protein